MTELQIIYGLVFVVAVLLMGQAWTGLVNIRLKRTLKVVERLCGKERERVFELSKQLAHPGQAHGTRIEARVREAYAQLSRLREEANADQADADAATAECLQVKYQLTEVQRKAASLFAAHWQMSNELGLPGLAFKDAPDYGVPFASMVNEVRRLRSLERSLTPIEVRQSSAPATAQ